MLLKNHPDVADLPCGFPEGNFETYSLRRFQLEKDLDLRHFASPLGSDANWPRHLWNWQS